MAELRWPDLWQPEAIAVAAPYVDTDERLDILVDDPAVAVYGTRMAGHLYRGEDDSLMIIYDKSGRPNVFPWRVMTGPVLVIKLLRPGRRAQEIYRHPEWDR